MAFTLAGYDFHLRRAGNGRSGRSAASGHSDYDTPVIVRVLESGFIDHIQALRIGILVVIRAEHRVLHVMRSIMKTRMPVCFTQPGCSSNFP